jgi:hypothetical protein
MLFGSSTLLIPGPGISSVRRKSRLVSVSTSNSPKVPVPYFCPSWMSSQS